MSLAGARFGGKVSPAAMLADALGQADQFERAIVIVKYKDTEQIASGYSSGEPLEALGMLDIAQDQLIQMVRPE